MVLSGGPAGAVLLSKTGGGNHYRANGCGCDHDVVVLSAPQICGRVAPNG